MSLGIADGSAAEKWNGSFHDTACCAHLEDEKRNELLYRTPEYQAWQSTAWFLENNRKISCLWKKE
ncbi:CbrC family protein [Paenibacillus terrae]|uniref:CbrC family protein n=1 Tax=Paenibacillus terrae TaxID=159743 RepID=UPI0009E1D6D6|nr:CbrC family protein [Paenibacillus terrae]